MMKEMTVSELKDLMDAKKDVILIDVREQHEWDEDYIEGAILLPKSEFPGNLKSFNAYKDKPIVLQCRSGRRSFDVGLVLLQNGFSDLSNLEGGILAWIDQGFPTKTKK